MQYLIVLILQSSKQQQLTLHYNYSLNYFPHLVISL